MMPYNVVQKINTLLRWQDRLLYLCGRLLLLEALKNYNENCQGILSKITYNKFGKPRCGNKIDFNISHSEQYVVCAVTVDGKVGIDIEKIKPVDIVNFNGYFSVDESADISSSPNRAKKFFEYWTKKESILKADGKGFSTPLKNVQISGDSAFLNNSKWYLNEIKINTGYVCFLATNAANPIINISRVFFE
jgi:4'-phosphopantetheinyl transferase